MLDANAERDSTIVTLAVHEGERLSRLVEALRDIKAESGALPAERIMAEQLKVKRHTLRRALEVMRANGELMPPQTGRRPTDGTRAKESLASRTNPVEIIELRAVIEPSLARFAALRATPGEIAQIQRAAMTPPNVDPGSADLAFHVAIAMGSRNTLASEFYRLIRQIATDTRLRLGGSGSVRQCPKRTAERDAEHAAIGAAIAQRDPDAAERAMRMHMEAVQRQITSRLGPGIPIL